MNQWKAIFILFLVYLRFCWGLSPLSPPPASEFPVGDMPFAFCTDKMPGDRIRGSPEPFWHANKL